MSNFYWIRSSAKQLTQVVMALTLATCSGLATAQQAKAAPLKDGGRFSKAELVYLTLLGEMQLQAGSSGAGFSLLLNAAKRSEDPELFKRAIQVALQSRAGDSALDAAKAWAEAQPQDPEPLRFAIQALAGMERLEETIPLIEKLLDRVPHGDQGEVLNAVGQLFSATKGAAQSYGLVAPMLKRWQAKTDTQSASWAAAGRILMAAGQPEKALDSLRQAMESPKPTEMAAMLAIDWLGKPSAPPEDWLHTLLLRQPQMFRARLAYARHLMRQERWKDSRLLLEQLTQTDTTNQVPPESWLLLGALRLQDRQSAAAKAAFEVFLEKTGGDSSAQLTAGRNQAYLSLSQIAEEGRDLEAAARWLDRITDEEDAMRVSLRRANLLVKTGRWQDAVALIRAIPDKAEDRNKARWIAEAQVLREAGQEQTAFNRLTEALEQLPNDTDVLFEQATLAEKLGRHADMELLLRQVLRLDPENHHAMNFLGYSMADRGDRLPEAKALIERALSHAPNDPFITDSLGWVEFRLGHHALALDLLQRAFDNRPDAEIALHLGEVLWVTDRKEAAVHMFRKAAQLQPANPLLMQVIQRLGVPWP